jgi:nucleoside-diphosphate-sugar epimerase
MKVAVLGANGQVGSEVCLLLRRVAGVEVVPICRNRSGSAFLRWHGVPCRHGLATDPAQARGLLGDCDVVANFALAVDRPREAREANRRLIDAAADASMPGARIVYFSTLAVYRTFFPAGTPGGLTAYGREKLRGERDALRAGRRTGKPTWALRLGHVYGELQGIRDGMRRLVGGGPVVVPRGGELASNVVHTVTIVDAIRKIAAGGERPGVYDLVSHPSWSWRQVLTYEAECAGLDVRFEPPDADPFEAASRGLGERLRSRVRAAAGVVLASPRTREIGLAWITHLPASWNLRLQSRNFQRRAELEIAQLRRRPISHEAFSIPPIEPKALTTLAPTIELLRRGEGAVPPAGAGAFPQDLPPSPT